MVTYKIKFDKKVCIGSGLCASVAPENWKLVETESGMKAKPKKILISEDEYDSNSQAADMCPVEAILIDKEKKRRVAIDEDFSENFDDF